MDFDKAPHSCVLAGVAKSQNVRSIVECNRKIKEASEEMGASLHEPAI
jgi:hypothetical protein